MLNIIVIAICEWHIFQKLTCGGEIFIPKIPSYNILDIAKAIAPNCKRIFTGIRPGEKLHEEMITQSDAMNTIDCEDYYVILPSTLFLSKEEYDRKNNISSTLCKYGFSYSSENNNVFLTVGELIELINTVKILWFKIRRMYF